MVFLGDTEQIDLKNKGASCLERVSELFQDQEYAGSVPFEDEDSVRNPIIPELLKLLKDEE
jgi:phosphate starvation-inducible protein PhoH